MVIFLYGSDAYRLKEAKDELVNRYKAKYSSGMNLFAVDLFEPDGMDMLENVLKSSSFFNEHKLLVCKNAFGKKTAGESLTRHIQDQDIAGTPDITLILAETLAGKELETKNKELFRLLSGGKSMVKEFEPLSGEKLSEWIRKEFTVRNCSIGTAAVRRLVNIVGNDSWAVMSEVEKLANYKKGEVTSADIQALVQSQADMNIFDLVDAIGAKDRRRALELLYRELKTGRDPYYILTMVIYQFRNLLTIKDLLRRDHPESGISQKAKLHPFVVKKALKSPFELEGAIEVYGKLLVIDSGFKMGELDLTDSLYGLALA